MVPRDAPRRQATNYAMRKTTMLDELLFLLMFVVLFATTYALMQRALLPHGYNKMVVLVLSSIVVALLTIFLRFRLFFRNRETP